MDFISDSMSMAKIQNL